MKERQFQNFVSQSSLPFQLSSNGLPTCFIFALRFLVTFYQKAFTSHGGENYKEPRWNKMVSEAQWTPNTFEIVSYESLYIAMLM